MELPVCKCCGQTLPGALEFGGVHFSPMQKKIVDRVHKAGKGGVTLAMLVNHVYADDPDGGPIHAERSVHVQLCIVNRKLAPANRRVEANKSGGQGAFYRMVQL